MRSERCEYKVATGTTPRLLAEVVNQLIIEGWELYGGVAAVSVAPGVFNLYQAMIFYPEVTCS